MACSFPLFTDIQNAPVLIFGAGVLALDKIQKLKPFSPCVTVFSPHVCDKIAQMGEAGELCIVRRSFAHAEETVASLLPRLAIIADVDDSDASLLFTLCRRYRLEVNTVDRQEYCTVIFPSTVTKKNLTVAVSTFGSFPTAAKKIREEIERSLPDALDEIIDQLAELRARLNRQPGVKRSQLRALYREAMDLAFAQNRILEADQIEYLIGKYT